MLKIMEEERSSQARNVEAITYTNRSTANRVDCGESTIVKEMFFSQTHIIPMTMAIQRSSYLKHLMVLDLKYHWHVVCICEFIRKFFMYNPSTPDGLYIVV